MTNNQEEENEVERDLPSRWYPSMTLEDISPQNQDQKVKMLVTQSHLILCNPMDSVAHHAPLSMEFSRQEYWGG